MAHAPRRPTALFIAFFVALAVLGAGVVPAVDAYQDADDPAIEVGSGPVGEPSLSLVGRSDYGPEAIQLYGFLNGVTGIGGALLYGDAPAGASATRFTFFAEIGNVASESRADITTFSGEGTLQIFLNETGEIGASWDDPASFAAGDPIATFAITLHDSLQRQAPGVGVIVGDETLAQTEAPEFTLDGTSYRLGQVGIGQRLRFVGVLASGDGGSFTVSLSGATTVTDRDKMIVRLGNVAPEGTTEAASDGCTALVAWQGGATEALTEAQELAAVVGVNVGIETLDAAAVRQAATDVAALAASQRQVAAPEAAVSANQLIVTALSTTARGLDTVAQAATANDEDLLTLGLTTLSDGAKLSERATAAAADAGAGCPPE